MKTEVSLPDPVFAAVEQLAARLGSSLNEIYTRAVTDWLARHQEPKQGAKGGWEHWSDEEITARLNEVYAHEPSHLDPFLAQLQARTFEKEEW